MEVESHPTAIESLLYSCKGIVKVNDTRERFSKTQKDKYVPSSH